MKFEGKIVEQLGSWAHLFKNYIEGDDLGKIFGFLKSETAKGKEIFPKSTEVFKSFELCPKDSVKAVIFLMDPYPSKKDKTIVANGVPMSCVNTGVLQPSLEIFYQAIETEYCGFNPDIDYRFDNSYLLTQEGVLLLNTALTVEMSKSGSHQDIWHTFTKYFIEEILNKFYRGLPIALCGEKAQRLEKYINPLVHHILKTSHPASISHNGGSEWKTDMFRWIDRIVESNNGKEHAIRWYRTKQEADTANLPEWITKKILYKSVDSENCGMPWELQ